MTLLTQVRLLPAAPGYCVDIVEADKVTRTIRSGVRATATNAYYSSIVNSPKYANQSTSIEFPRAELDTSVISFSNCPEYAAAITEIGELTGTINFLIGSPVIDEEGWWLINPSGELPPYRYFTPFSHPAGGTIFLPTKQIDIQVDRTDPNIQVEESGFSLTSAWSADGTPLPSGKFAYVVGRKERASIDAGSFIGHVRWIETTWAWSSLYDDFVPSDTRDELVPATGGWESDAVSTEPVVGAWAIAQYVDTPEEESVTSLSTGGLDVEQAFLGNYSSWYGAGTGGVVSQLLPPGASGGE